MRSPNREEPEFPREHATGALRANARPAPGWPRDWVQGDYGRFGRTASCANMTTPAKARPRPAGVRDGLRGDSRIAAVEASLGLGASNLSAATLEAAGSRLYPGRLRRVTKLMPEGQSMPRDTAFGTSFGPLAIDSQMLSTAVVR